MRVAQPLLKLDRWNIRIAFDPKMEDDAECIAQPEYRNAVLRFRVKDLTWEELPSYVLHELMHCHVESLGALALALAGEDEVRRTVVTSAEENLTTTLEELLVPLLLPLLRPSAPEVPLEG